MRNNGKGTERPQFLSGWKDIANYLGKGVRTVQRYEREMGLPVRRPAGRETGSVVATKVELDAWIHASPMRKEGFGLRSQPWIDATGMTTSIRAGVAEMVRLREQMTALRNEVRISVQLLRNSLYGLQGDLHSHKLGETPGAIPLLEPEQRTSGVLNLPHTDSGRKAS
ncbi:MAG TPA: hypothetical protein VFA67_00305 [Candidatus Sulfotelmatobacter sp.]|nr:hypothetical protein [Candidatus Sulfotelmatobacter sp.]